MAYRDRDTGEIKTGGTLRKENPNMSFPKVWNANVFDALNVDPILSTPRPSYGEYQTAIVTGVEQDSSGNWVEKWTVSDLYADYTNEDGEVVTKAQQEADHQTRLDAVVTMNNKAKRDQDLKDTDWWAVADRTMTAEQTAYRQALRDITTHANWPHLNDDDWPTKP